MSQTERPAGTTEWRAWSEVPWFSRTGGIPELQLAIRLVEAAAKADSLPPYLTQQLPDVASEFAAQWAAVLYRDPQWVTLGEFGRRPVEDLPIRFLEDSLDRSAGGYLSGAGWSFIAIPLRAGSSVEVLALCGRSLSNRSLPGAMAAARALGFALDVVRRADTSHRRIDRLRSVLKIASQFSVAQETPPLLKIIAHEAARLLECDRSSIFIWDRPHHELVACPALGVEGDVLRLPDNVGIVGECVQTGNIVRVDDAYQDPRFNKQVDVSTGYKTRNILCVPLLDGEGQRIGAFEGINKRSGKFTPEDEEALTEFGIQAAVALQNVREREHLVRRHKQLTEQMTQGVQIIGESPAIAAMRATVDRLAATDLPVLVLGESGTGKEVVAQSLHYRGNRRDQPFVAVNCAALTETLLESELFGHEKGAFTDAREMRRGKFELAEGGTLFLDEIGDMSLGGQAKLLRVLEQKVITRVGGSQPIRINVRVVAATNAKLVTLVREKKFREDLYFRLSVVTLDLPPLRNRPEDIIPLAEFFLDKFNSRRAMILSNEARRRLQMHAWPGNVRELRNLMERVALLCEKDRVDGEDLTFNLNPDLGGGEGEDAYSGGLADATCDFQRDYIRRVIKRAQGNMSQAAEMLGLHRSNLYRKMRQLEMEEAGGMA